MNSLISAVSELSYIDLEKKKKKKKGGNAFKESKFLCSRHENMNIYVQTFPDINTQTFTPLWTLGLFILFVIDFLFNFPVCYNFLPAYPPLKRNCQCEHPDLANESE